MNGSVCEHKTEKTPGSLATTVPAMTQKKSVNKPGEANDNPVEIEPRFTKVETTLVEMNSKSENKADEGVNKADEDAENVFQKRVLEDSTPEKRTMKARRVRSSSKKDGAPKSKEPDHGWEEMREKVVAQLLIL